LALNILQTIKLHSLQEKEYTATGKQRRFAHDSHRFSPLWRFLQRFFTAIASFPFSLLNHIVLFCFPIGFLLFSIFPFPISSFFPFSFDSKP
jgi:hypothetical protein